MMEISSKLVAELRSETGAGVMDCKRALLEARGDFEEARKILRKRGIAVAAGKAGRATMEGLVIARLTPEAGALLEVNCETDFVARTEKFRSFVEALADSVAANEALGETRQGTPEELLPLPAGGDPGESVSERVSQLIAALRENIRVRRYARLLPRPGEKLSSYVHGDGRIGVLVSLAGRDPDLGKELAMHIAAAEPRFTTRSEVTPEILEAEREIARAQAGDKGKSPEVVERIAQGKVEKFYQETVLTEQAFVKKPETTVGQVLVERGGRQALDLRFVRFKLGEGIGRAEAVTEASAGARG